MLNSGSLKAAGEGGVQVLKTTQAAADHVTDQPGTTKIDVTISVRHGRGGGMEDATSARLG
eukprot:975281-Rhodomonas_salina.1